LGLGALTLQMFAYSSLHIKFSLFALLLPWLFIVIATTFVFRKAPPLGEELPREKNRVFDIALLAGIIFQVFHAFFKALIKPMDSFDSIGNFAYKAKLFFTGGYIPYELFLDRSIDIQHPDYPLFIPLSETWVYMFLGRCNDLLVKALFPMFFLAVLVIFYFVLKRVIGKRLSLVTTFFLATIPHFLNYATIGYADFALTMFYTASFLYIFLWISYKRESKYLFLAPFLAVLAVWAKHEGVMFLLINIALLVLYILINRRVVTRKDLNGIASFLSITVAFTIIWFAYFHMIGFSNEFVNKETLHLSAAIKHLGRIPLILYEYEKHIFGPKKWNISYLVFLLGFVFYFRKSFLGNFKYITLSILLSFAGYSFFYLITPLEIRYHLQTSGSRMLIHFLPVTVFWIGYLAREILNAESNIHR
jgi:4-amino-4-deoxy-L-arabinose transferase-like glycosyltransferase